MARAKPAPVSVWRQKTVAYFLTNAPHYPEYVDESYWPGDAERRAMAGAHTVRMGEFAWHPWQPYEGHLSFDVFDRAIDVLGHAGVKTVLCTPTATPPRWLTAHYPEVLRVDAQGRHAGHGSRQHADTTSPVFRRHSQRITKAIADNCRDNPHVVGWQTDNELNTAASESCSPSARLAFQTWLHLHYSDISVLNYACPGAFWALAYDTFEQIDLPRPMAASFLSPGHVQAYHRFLAAVTAAFQHDQIEILRATNPDFTGFDIYPIPYDEFRRFRGHAYAKARPLDTSRAATGNFLIPEQASGFGRQPGFSTMTPEPAEIPQIGVIDHYDVPCHRYHDASQFFGEMHWLESQIPGTHVRMDLAGHGLAQVRRN